MAMFKSGNLALKENTFTGFERIDDDAAVMTLQGTVNKMGFLLLSCGCWRNHGASDRSVRSSRGNRRGVENVRPEAGSLRVSTPAIEFIDRTSQLKSVRSTASPIILWPASFG
jgi:hypothetical protein